VISEADEHVPVLVEELSGYLQVRRGQVFVDATVGLGGHSLMILKALGPSGCLIGLDRDSGSLSRARERLSGLAGEVRLYPERFSRLGKVLGEMEVSVVDGILADLGVNSSQLGAPDRGFSYLKDGPLDMRMDRGQKVTAEQLVNGLAERELADLIYRNSQERFSRRIAKRICRVRREGRIKTTRELVRVICDALEIRDPLSRRSKTHPAMRTFQALRMAVNEEVEELRSFLEQSAGCLKPGGHLAVISFHSVEDRAVKRDFLSRKRRGTYEILTKKPIIPSKEERARNPRSRSAKLRVVRRTELTDHEEERGSV